MSVNQHFAALRVELDRAMSCKRIYDAAAAIMEELGDEVKLDGVLISDVLHDNAVALGPCIAEMEDILAQIKAAYTAAINTAAAEQAATEAIEKPGTAPDVPGTN